MGANNSSQEDLSKNEHLNRLVSKEVLTPSDPFWNSFLSFNFSQPRTKTEWKTFEQNIEELQKRFLISNLKTGNFVSLIKVVLLRHSELKDSVLSENSVFIWQTCNALFIVRTVVKFMVERIKEEDVVNQFLVSPGGEDEDSETESMLSTFLSSMIELLVETPLQPQSYHLHVEATRVLHVLLGGVLYSPGKPAHQLSVWRSMMSGGCSVMSTPLTCVLLQRYCDQTPAPDLDTGGSLVLGLASSVWSILTLGYGSGDPNTENERTLADISLSLILLLTNHCTDTSAFKNPFRDALFSFANASEKTLDTEAQFRMEYPSLFSTLASTLHTEEATLLLYLLLHRNTKFRSYVLAGSDIDQLVIPILHTLYTCTVSAEQASNHHIYMSLIILLIASEEDLFNQTVHSSILKGPQVQWYTERAVTQLSLGGLLILVVIRTIQYNMLKMRDKYLHTNCLAALANMSGQFKGLHPYVAQRIVSLFETLARKHARLVDGLQGVDDAGEDGFDEVSEAVQDAAVLEEVLRMVLEIINSCIVHQTQHNPNLIYTILYKKDLFEIAAKNPAFQDLTGNIMIVLVYMSSRLEQVQERKGRGLTVDEVQEVVRVGATQFPRDRLTKLPDLKFKYVEEDKPEDFFIPYVWTLAQNKLYWNQQHIKLFSS